MPELPEVETLKRELEAHVLGRTITGVRVLHSLVVRQPGKAEFMRRLQGARITRILRKGKILIFELSNGRSLTVHLKMTGQLVYPGAGTHARVIFLLSDGTTLNFNDQRMFGELRLLSDWRALPFLRALGPEPFELGVSQFKQMLAQKKTRIKPLLMDQTFIAGIGNLYAAEALFRAKVHPDTRAQDLSEKQKEVLFKQLRGVLQKAISCGGSSVDDYVRLSGTRGGYSAHHKVYGRRGLPCLSCKTPVERIVTGGRGTYYCPQCQKRYGGPVGKKKNTH